MSVTFNSKLEEVSGSTLNLINNDGKSKRSGMFQTSAWRTRAVAVFLGLLCLLLLVMTCALIAQSFHAKSYWDQLHMSRLNGENLSSQWIQLRTNFNNLSESRDQLETKFKSLIEERDALKNETKQMKINTNNLLDSRNQLENKFNVLIKERDALRNQTEQLKTDVNNVSETRDQLQTNFSSLTKERNALRNQTEQLIINFNNMSESRDQLETKLTSMTEDRDALKNETEQLKINADHMSESKGQLETKFKSLTEERDTLRNETEQLKITAGNVSKEMELLQSQYNSVAATRDALQREVDELKGSVQLCQRKWMRFNNKCYYFSAKGEGKSWRNSKQDCVNKGGHLAIVTTREELEFICNLYDDVWIGLSDSANEGTWKWVDGTSLVGDGFWFPGEPNNAGNKEDCAHAHKTDNDPAGWNDNTCNLALSYVCEA